MNSNKIIINKCYWITDATDVFLDAKSSTVPDVKNTHDSEINYNDDSHESKQKLLVTKTDGCEINQISKDIFFV